MLEGPCVYTSDLSYIGCYRLEKEKASASTHVGSPRKTTADENINPSHGIPGISPYTAELCVGQDNRKKLGGSLIYQIAITVNYATAMQLVGGKRMSSLNKRGREAKILLFARYI